MNGIHLGVPEVEYHLDPAFSQSQAKTLLSSPAKYRWGLDNPPAPRDVFDFGHAVHAKVLGVGLDFLTVGYDDWRSKAARDMRDEARAAGLVPMLAKDLAAADRMAEAVLANAGARAILESEGDVEVSMWWDDADTGVECRGRIDKLAATPGGLVNVDLKTTADASLRGFAKSAANFGYHIQAAAYEDGLRDITSEDCPTVLIAVEKDPPHLVALYEFPSEEVGRGLDKWRDALAALVKYRDADYWPGYPDSIQPLYLPSWA
jgi:hypothetical protein